jgi:hypothetical protein
MQTLVRIPLAMFVIDGSLHGRIALGYILKEISWRYSRRRIQMRHTLVHTITAVLLVAALIGMPGIARSQVVIIIGNGAAQPYYPQPYPPPYPYPHRHVVYGGPGYYPDYAGYGDYGGYDNGGYNNGGYYNGYAGYYRPYRYGW